MIELYKPDIYKRNIYDINYKRLKSIGIKCILFDLDNTLVPYYKSKPSRKLKDFIEKLKSMGFKIIIFSNSSKKRLTPFKRVLEVDCSASSRKPSEKKFRKVLVEYKFDQSEVCIIGDQIMTDVFGGNRIGILTIFVNPISKNEPIWTKINRMRESKKIKKLEKKGIFKRGEFYD